MDGCTREAERFTQPVFNVSGIAEVKQLGIIDKQHDRRRFHRYLRGIVDLELTAVVRFGGIHHLRIQNDIIQDIGGYAECAHFMHLVDQRD